MTTASWDDDARCMERLKSGDDLALNELIARWQKPLVAFVLRYTGNETDAVDLAQETFVRVYDGRHRYQPNAKFSTWLFCIAVNLCRNLTRWRERHPTVPIGGTDGSNLPLEDTLSAPGGTPADNAERDDLASAVREHIQKLPHDLRTVILLFEYQDMGYEEIAASLGCTPKAIETRLYRARHLLRESLTRWKIA